MNEQPNARQVIRAAIAAAGGTQKAGQCMGITSQAISGWAASGRVPAERIKPLCDLGGNVVTPLQILDAMAREAAGKVAA